MKNLATTLVAVIALTISTSVCAQNWKNETIVASKNYVTKDIKVQKFNKISVAGSPDVFFTQKAGSPKVEVYTSDNIAEVLEIKVKDNTLHIGFKKNTSIKMNGKKLEIRVSAETLSALSVAGSGDIYLNNGLKANNDLSVSVAGSGDIQGKDIQCNNLKISVAGSGDIKAERIQTSTLKVSVAGSGDIKLKDVNTVNTEANVAGSGTVSLSGATQSASYNVSGSGNLFANSFEAKNVSANVSGSGNIKCFATDFLKVRTSGSGKVGYKGNPELDYPKKSLYKL